MDSQAECLVLKNSNGNIDLPAHFGYDKSIFLFRFLMSNHTHFFPFSVPITDDVTMKIRVSNIDRSTTAEELEQLFEEFGEVIDLDLHDEPDPGEETFSAWVEMVYQADAEEAIDELNGEWIDGRNIKVISEEKAQKLDRPSRDSLDHPDVEEEVMPGKGKITSRKAVREDEARPAKKAPRRGGKR